MGRFVLVAAILALALCGAVAALDLCRAAVVGGAYQADPLVELVVDQVDPAFLGPSGVDYEDAAGIASLDFRYPYRQAIALWVRKTGRVPDRAKIVLANELFREAAGRAPTFAPARYFFAVTSLSLGEAEVADRNALAALHLAPLHQDIRRKVAVYFEQRFRETRSDLHLAAAFKAMGPERETLIRSVLSDPMMSYERVDQAFQVSRISGEERLGVLMSMGRWDWAIRAARELDGQGVTEGRREGEVRTRYSIWLMGMGAKDAALREAELGAALLGSEYRQHGVLARARLLAGEFESGLLALRTALDEDLTVAAAEAMLGSSEFDPARIILFWEGRRGAPESGFETRLALSRAQIAAGRLLDARMVLKALIERNQAYAEAHFLLARTFIRSGNREMALRYARAAASAEPEERRYARLVRTIEKEIR